MRDYQPIDLHPCCNVGVRFIAPEASPPVGDQIFHGLPFRVGGSEPDPARCFIGFSGEGGTHENVTVSIGATARCMIFAHALLESRLLEGENLGHLVAHYRFRFAGGEEVRVPIRERFEIGGVPTPWGGLPFLAVPDQRGGNVTLGRCLPCAGRHGSHSAQLLKL